MNEARVRRTPTMALLLCVLLSGGCGGAWPAYKQIQVGKPLPDGHLLEGKPSTRGAGGAWGSRHFWPLPAVSCQDEVSVAVDASGNVTGKYYDASAYGHWGVALSAATRTVLEVRIPEAVYHDPPLDWKDPRYLSGRFNKILEIERALEPLAKEAFPNGMTMGMSLGPEYSSPLATQETHTYGMVISGKRLTERVRKQLQEPMREVPVTLGTDVDLSGLANAEMVLKANLETVVYREKEGRVWLKFSVTVARQPASNVLEYINALQFPKYQGQEPFRKYMGFQLLLLPFYGLYMYHHNKVICLADLGEYPAALAGITREGYDWTYRNSFGGTIRIRNLGDRRICIDSRGMTLGDPLMLSMVLSFLLRDENDLYRAVVARRTQLIGEEPDRGEYYLLRAATQAKKHYWKQALDDCGKAAALVPDDKQIRSTLRDLQAKAGRYDEGATSFSREVRWRDTAVTIINTRGVSYTWDDDQHRGITTFTRIIRNEGDNPRAYNNRGVSYYELGRYTEALADFSKAVELDPKYSRAYANRAHTHAKLRQYQKAWADVDACRQAGGSLYDDILHHLRKVAPRKD